MFPDQALRYFQEQLADLKAAALFKDERIITSRQSTHVTVKGRAMPVINLCANNYLGLSGDIEVAAAAQQAIARYGYGLSSVRFICGTQDIHKELERRLSGFFGTDDTILYSSCFDANTGLFETLFDERDAIISDELNHASIIDGVRLARIIHTKADGQQRLAHFDGAKWIWSMFQTRRGSSTAG